METTGRVLTQAEKDAFAADLKNQIAAKQSAKPAANVETTKAKAAPAPKMALTSKAKSPKRVAVKDLQAVAPAALPPKVRAVVAKPAAQPAGKYLPNLPATNLVLVDQRGQLQPFKYNGKLVWSVPGMEEAALRKTLSAQPAYTKGGMFITVAKNDRADGEARVAKYLRPQWKNRDPKRWTQPNGADWSNTGRADMAESAAKWTAEAVALAKP